MESSWSPRNENPFFIALLVTFLLVLSDTSWYKSSSRSSLCSSDIRADSPLDLTSSSISVASDELLSGIPSSTMLYWIVLSSSATFSSATVGFSKLSTTVYNGIQIQVLHVSENRSLLVYEGLDFRFVNIQCLALRYPVQPLDFFLLASCIARQKT